jgi:hypothetical protein
LAWNSQVKTKKAEFSNQFKSYPHDKRIKNGACVSNSKGLELDWMMLFLEWLYEKSGTLKANLE